MADYLYCRLYKIGKNININRKNVNMIKYLFSLLFIFSVFLLNAQTNRYFGNIKKTFDKKGQDELNNVLKALKTAQKYFDEGEKIFSSKDISKALVKSKKASSIFNTNYRSIYILYTEKLENIVKNTEGDKKIYFRKKLQDAKNYYRVAIYNRLKAEEEKETKTVYDLLDAAHKNELLAVDELSNMFAVINGWETTDYSIQENNYNLKETYTNVNTKDFTTRSFSVNNPSLENSFKFNYQIVSENKNNGINNSNNNNNNYNNSNVYGTSAHEYRIQIGVSILPANQSQLKRLNKTDKPVSTYKSKVYYKYTVGSFSDFQEAKNFKNAYGLKNVYIVEYRNGKQVKFYMKDYQ